MIRPRNEHTIAHPCSVSGRGYWSGRQTTVRISPASVGTGVRMIRTDLPDCPELTVSVDVRRDHELRTVLISGAARIAMVEHLMAALCAMEIDNCLVELDAEELPGLDGSAAPYVQALREAGLVIQAAPRNRLIVDRTLRVGTAAHWIEVSPSPDGRSHYEYRLDYGDACPIRPQTFSIALAPDSFCREVAPARTFVTAEQVAQLRASGVAAHVTTADLLVFDDAGPVDNALRFSDECARHKTLDMVGDLALVGMDLVGRFVSYRGGHNLNAQMAARLRRLAQAGPEYECRRAA